MQERIAAMHELGKITVYSAAARSGLIKTSKGSHLYFSMNEWRSKDSEPRPGQSVRFIQGFYAAKNVEIVLPAGKSG